MKDRKGHCTEGQLYVDPKLFWKKTKVVLEIGTCLKVGLRTWIGEQKEC